MLKKKQCETESNWYKRYIDCPISQSKITKIQVQRVYSDTNHEQKNLIFEDECEIFKYEYREKN